MKRLFPILAALALFATACQLGGGGGGLPTSIALPTTAPTSTSLPFLPTAEGSSNTPQPGSDRVSPADGMPQVYVPEGTFYMGGLDPKAAQNEKPVHQVTMRGFWLDKVEVTNGMYSLCVTAGGCRLPLEFKSTSRTIYYSNPDFTEYPVIYVTWYEADTYCHWAGRRLPSEAEWERAARGDDTRIYPWGDLVPDASHANFNSFFGDTTRVGDIPGSASQFGVLDMAGNVAEWTNDFYDADYYGSGVNFNPPGPSARSSSFERVVRGGTFQDADSDIRVSKRSSVVGSDPTALVDSAQWLGTYSPKIGFRCASDY
ncbi:MAG TPA: SUMF1/EgtB/PvdO family nonheme iron enzyme [Anaerolineales bacterium]